MANDHAFDVIRWILLPILYAAATVPVLLASLFVVGSVERVFGCTWACEISGLLALLAVGAPLFASLSLGLVRLERPRTPTLLDHLRHCVALYAGLAALGVVLVLSYGAQRYGLSWAVGAALFLASAYAASVDAVVVYAIRRRAVRGP